MDPVYEKELNSCGIKKSHVIEVIVRETTSDTCQTDGAVLWKTKRKGFGTMHAVIKSFYEALPEYRGKRVYVQVRNETAGKIVICSSHYMPLNRIPLYL